MEVSYALKLFYYLLWTGSSKLWLYKSKEPNSFNLFYPYFNFTVTPSFRERLILSFQAELHIILYWSRAIRFNFFYFLPAALVRLENGRLWYISSYCAKYSLDMFEGDCGEGRKKWYPKYWQEEVRFCQYFSYNLEMTLFYYFCSYVCIFKRKSKCYRESDVICI